MNNNESITFKEVIRELVKFIVIFFSIVLFSLAISSILLLLDSYVFNGQISINFDKFNKHMVYISFYVINHIELVLFAAVLFTILLLILAIIISWGIRLIFGAYNLLRNTPRPDFTQKD